LTWQLRAAGELWRLAVDEDIGDSDHPNRSRGAAEAAIPARGPLNVRLVEKCGG